MPSCGFATPTPAGYSFAAAHFKAAASGAMRNSGHHQSPALLQQGTAAAALCPPNLPTTGVNGTCCPLALFMLMLMPLPPSPALRLLLLLPPPAVCQRVFNGAHEALNAWQLGEKDARVAQLLSSCCAGGADAGDRHISLAVITGKLHPGPAGGVGNDSRSSPHAYTRAF